MVENKSKPLARRLAGVLAGALAPGLVALACSDSEDPNHGGSTEGVPSGATCPPVSTLTYENFGKPFFESYCTRCHSSSVTGNARNGAPADHDFDVEDAIIAVAEHIDGLAAAGPASVNTNMPPSDPKPTEAERRQLGEWLACEAESSGGDGGH